MNHENHFIPVIYIVSMIVIMVITVVTIDDDGVVDIINKTVDVDVVGIGHFYSAVINNNNYI